MLIANDAFAFKPAADAKKIAIEAIRDFDEVPDWRSNGRKEMIILSRKAVMLVLGVNAPRSGQLEQNLSAELR